MSFAARDDERINLWEGLFIFWSLGFALDEFASMRENGITACMSRSTSPPSALTHRTQTGTASTTARLLLASPLHPLTFLSTVLDSLFCFIFFIFLGLRIQGLLTHDLDLSELAFDTLALAACILFPRLSISLIRGNVVLLALSAMIKEFV